MPDFYFTSGDYYSLFFINKPINILCSVFLWDNSRQNHLSLVLKLYVIGNILLES